MINVSHLWRFIAMFSSTCNPPIFFLPLLSFSFMQNTHWGRSDGIASECLLMVSPRSASFGSTLIHWYIFADQFSRCCRITRLSLCPSYSSGNMFPSNQRSSCESKSAMKPPSQSELYLGWGHKCSSEGVLCFLRSLWIWFVATLLCQWTLTVWWFCRASSGWEHDVLPSL